MDMLVMIVVLHATAHAQGIEKQHNVFFFTKTKMKESMGSAPRPPDWDLGLASTNGLEDTRDDRLTTKAHFPSEPCSPRRESPEIYFT